MFSVALTEPLPNRLEGDGLGDGLRYRLGNGLCHRLRYGLGNGNLSALADARERHGDFINVVLLVRGTGIVSVIAGNVVDH